MDDAIRARLPDFWRKPKLGPNGDTEVGEFIVNREMLNECCGRTPAPVCRINPETCRAQNRWAGPLKSNNLNRMDTIRLRVGDSACRQPLTCGCQASE